ncbi:MAG: DUF6776 family protein [Corticimicrobacter sp.]|uniref:DUF6776 family protein n=1 Tax=Corticimicrobacter sp. TaxID=2678536 RepID=UPI0032DB116B
MPVADQASLEAAPAAGRARRRRRHHDYAVFALGAVAGALLCALALWLLFLRPEPAATPVTGVAATPEERALQANLQQKEAELRFLRAQLDTADGQIAIEQGARQSMEQSMRALQDEIGGLRERLAFFEQLLPPGPAGSVGVRGMDVKLQGDALSFTTLVTRQGQGLPEFSGMLRFSATGLQNGNPVTLALHPVTAAGSAVGADAGAVSGSNAPAEVQAGEAHDAALVLRFDQYQRNQGVLAIPPGFVPESVTVQVLEGDSVRATHTQQLPL